MKMNSNSFFRAIKGYKITDGHFELGSNLHIKDYYYAKRLFYNSFYTNRFAFLITQFILKEFQPLITRVLSASGKKGNHSTITLLGYDNYSELLVSSIRKMLNDHIMKEHKLDTEIFNHDIFTKESLFLKNPKKIGQHIISIFPISTTFSTSVKIQNEITDLLTSPRKSHEKPLLTEKPLFHDPVINCLIISNYNLTNSKTFSKSDIEYKFGWKAYDHLKKEITMINIDKKFKISPDHPLPPSILPTNEIRQKFFISVDTEWQSIHECNACYPTDLEKEICLIETKANSITPNILFGYPKSFQFEENSTNIFEHFNIKKIKGKPEPVVYRKHFCKHDNHYIYYIRIGRFLQENKRAINGWLTSLRGGKLRKLKDKNIVIVTPIHGANSGFVNYLNDVVFSDTATIIQYNPKEEFVQNFRIFYSDLLNQADYVIFVDDVLASTRTISDINFFIKNARKNQHGLDFSVSLINRMGYYNYLKLEDKLKSKESLSDLSRHLSFLNINVAPIAHRYKYPYVSLMEKFSELSRKSVLDSMKIHFKEKERYFRPIDLTKEYDTFENEGKPKALFQFLLMHEFIQLFSFSRKEKKYPHEKLISDVFESKDASSYLKLLDHFQGNHLHNAAQSFIEQYPEYRNEIKNGIFKICTSDPYLQHKNIRSSVFDWVLHSLVDIVEKINKDRKVHPDFFQAFDGQGPLVYSPYQTFRFLLKRGAKLKMNFIYSLQTLTAIYYIIQGIENYGKVQYYQAQHSSELWPEDTLHTYSKPIHSIGFVTYYVGLLQELIIEHESKALEIVINIKKLIDKNDLPGGEGKTLRNTYNDPFFHLLRLLVLENTFIFHSSSERILSKIKPEVYFSDKGFDNFFKHLHEYTKTYSFQYTQYMLSRFEVRDGTVTLPDEPEPEASHSFDQMMLLKALLKNDLVKKNINETVSIKEKIEKILEICCNIMGIERGGGFFAIKYKNQSNSTSTEDDIAIVGNYSRVEDTKFNTNAFPKESLLYKFFDGIKEINSKKKETIFEITLDNDYDYQFLNNSTFDHSDLANFFEFHDTLFRNLIYIRISNIERLDKGYETFAKAVICLYDNKVPESEVDKVLDKIDQHALKKNGQVALNFSTARSEEKNFDRFNPKKVRQLLLLRNDLGEFVDHHLNNDSLRAYVEVSNINNLRLTLRHGINEYETIVKTYIDRIKKSPDIQQINENAEYLTITYKSLINKLHLLSLAYKLFDQSDASISAMHQEHTLAELISGFKDFCKYVFLLDQPVLNNLDTLDHLVFDDSNISSQSRDLSFKLFPNVFNEIIFEILYNIKKHTIHNRYGEISNSNRLILKLEFINKNGQHWFAISNNLSTKSERLEKRLNTSLKDKKIDGLNLIYHIINKSSQKEIKVEIKDDVFTVFLPLILIHNS